jgi:SSS family solute:Na+ symporter
MNPILVGILAYVSIQIAIGVVVSRRIRTEDDYLVAGRRLGPTLATVSIFATWFGAETCVGATGSLYAEGLGASSVEPFAYGLCLVGMGLIFARPMWRAGITTLADLFRQRFGPSVETTAAVVLIPTSLFWAAAQVRAFGQVLATSADIEIATGVAVAAAIAIVYTMCGGLLADVVTDLVQGAALVVGLVVVTVAVVGSVGGPGEAFELLAAAPPNRVPPEPLSSLDVLEAWALPILGSITAQEVISRSLAARSAPVARNAAVIGGAAYLLVGLMPVSIGLLAAHSVPDLEDPDQVLATMAAAHLPTFGYVLFAGALISAILSTVDSALLAASSILSRNVLLAGRAEASQKTRIRTARLAVLGFGVVAWVLAHDAERVFDLIENASGFGSAGVLVVTCFGLFTRIGGTPAAILSLVSGAITWMLGAYVATDFAHPFLASLGAALAGYAIGAVFGRGRG